MAIAVDTTTTSIKTGAQANPTDTWSHTITGSNPFLIVSVTYTFGTGTTPSVTALTYNGVSLTKINRLSRANSNGTPVFNEVWFLAAPATGAHNVSYTITGDTFSPKLGASSFTGVDQSTPIGVTATGSGATTTATTNITTVTDNSLVYEGFSWEFMPNTATAGKTPLYNSNTGTDDIGASSYEISTTHGAYSNTYTLSSSNSSINSWASNIVEVKPVAATTTSTSQSTSTSTSLSTSSTSTSASTSLSTSSTSTSQSTSTSLSTSSTSTSNSTSTSLSTSSTSQSTSQSTSTSSTSSSTSTSLSTSTTHSFTTSTSSTSSSTSSTSTSISTSTTLPPDPRQQGRILQPTRGAVLTIRQRIIAIKHRRLD